VQVFESEITHLITTTMLIL